MIIKTDEAHILTHLGLGDNLTCHGLVREIHKKHSQSYVYCKLKYFYSVDFMYRDLPNLTVFPMEEIGAENFVKMHNIKNYYKIGHENMAQAETAEKAFYKQAGVDFNKKWDSFFIQRNDERENKLYSSFDFKENDYAFVHDDLSRNSNYTGQKQAIDITKISDPNLKVFRPKMEYTNNIFDYLKIIENAKEIHVMESSFMFLIDLAFKKIDKPLYLHRYSRGTPAWELPTNKLNWRVLE